MFFRAWRAERRRQRDRLLFRFWDGTRHRAVDPFRVWRDLQGDQTVQLDAMAPMVDQGQEPETSLVVGAIARAFGVERWTEESRVGMTDWEILNLLADLNDYLLDVKKKHSPGLTLSPSTA